MILYRWGLSCTNDLEKDGKAGSFRNEALRRVKLETGIIGQDLSSQFEIFGEMVKLVTHWCRFQLMVNILDGKNQFTIGGSYTCRI